MRRADVHADCAGDMGRQVQQEGRRVSAPGVQEYALGTHISHSLSFEDAVRMVVGRIVLRNQRGCCRGHAALSSKSNSKAALFKKAGACGNRGLPIQPAVLTAVTYNMLLMSLMSKFRRACKRDGFSGALRLAARNLAVMPAAFRPPTKKTWFDEKYGVDTDTWVEVEDLGVTAPSKAFACAYAPSP